MLAVDHDELLQVAIAVMLVTLTTGTAIIYCSSGRFQKHDPKDDRSSNHTQKQKKEYPPLASAGILETVQALANGGTRIFMVKGFQECGRIYRLRLPIPGVPMAVVIANIDDIRAIYKDPMTTKPTVFYNAISKFTGGANVSSFRTAETGGAWYHRRKPMNLAFAPKRIQSIKEIAMDIVETWANDRLSSTQNTDDDGGTVFDVGKEMIDVTIQIICHAVLDYPCTTRQEREELVQEAMAPAFQEFSTKEGFNPLRKLPLSSWILPDRRRALLGVQSLQAFATKVMDHYGQNPSPTPDTVIDVIMKNPIYQNDRERAADIIIILFGGHDTTGYTLALALRELARHPNDQARLRESLLEKPMEEAPAQDWSYLRAVITETMRMHPAVTGAGFRQLGHDYTTQHGGYFIPKGAVCFMSQIAIYRDPLIFQDPYEFQPSRWLNVAGAGADGDSGTASEDQLNKMRATMFPFALGKRNCVGQPLANAELYSFLPFLISQYEFTVEKEGIVSHPATVRLDDCWLKARRLGDN